jgi:hypothetical protein
VITIGMTDTDKYELDVKIQKLDYLIHQEVFKDLSVKKRALLIDQLDIMRKYSSILALLIQLDLTEHRRKE